MYQKSTGGIAFPKARYWLASFPERINESGKDWMRATSLGVNLLNRPWSIKTGSVLFNETLAK